MLAGDARDELGEDDGLAETRPAEETRLAAANERGEQVDDLDAGLEQLGLGGKLRKCRRLPMNGPHLRGGDRPAAIDRFAKQVEDAPQRFRSDGNAHGRA